MCSYCGCRSIPLIGRLSDQHEEIIDATTALRRAAADGDTTAAAYAVVSLGRLLHPHTGLEERGLFTELRRDDVFTDHVDTLCGEHRAIDEDLDAVASGRLDRVPALLRLLRDHIDKEENGLFPAAAILLDDDQWQRLHSDEGVQSPSQPA